MLAGQQFAEVVIFRLCFRRPAKSQLIKIASGLWYHSARRAGRVIAVEISGRLIFFQRVSAGHEIIEFVVTV